jgi:hypothetical protein
MAARTPYFPAAAAFRICNVRLLLSGAIVNTGYSFKLRGEKSFVYRGVEGQRDWAESLDDVQRFGTSPKTNTCTEPLEGFCGNVPTGEHGI